MFAFIRFGTTLLFCFAFCSLFAQMQERAVMQQLLTQHTLLREKMPGERLYVHTDRSYYAAGDTVWFKVYAFDEGSLQRTTKSGLVYLDYTDAAGRVISRHMVQIEYGLGAGCMVLDAETFPEGNYMLRAYTRYMMNFNPGKIFCKPVYVNDTGPVTFAEVKYQPTSPDSVAFYIRFTDITREPVILHNFSLRILQGEKGIYRRNLRTSMDGVVDVRARLDRKDSSRTLTVLKYGSRDSLKYRNFRFPLPLNRAEKTDVQFLPEGGKLVAGQIALIGFKAIGEDGLGVELRGKVVNRKNRTVAVFRSEHNGMGAFGLNVKKEEVYTALLELPGGQEKRYALPPVSPEGTSLHVRRRDSVIEILAEGTRLFRRRCLLVAEARGRIHYASIVSLGANGNRTVIPQSQLPTGVVRFTLLDHEKSVLNERRFFVHGADGLVLGITPHKPAYARRDSVSLHLQARNKQGEPVVGTFSVAVTDDGQIRPDSTHSITAALFLEQEVSGYIENPAQYLAAGADAQARLDLLMLTQGWTDHSWKDILVFRGKPAHAPEQEFSINGRVTNVFNKPVAGSALTLFSAKPPLVMETQTTPDGAFHFAGFPRIDSAVVFNLAAVNKRGKANNVGITIRDEQPGPDFTTKNSAMLPWFVNTQEALRAPLSTRFSRNSNKWAGAPGSRLLEEVSITARKMVKDSKNLNGAGKADEVLDEAVFTNSGKKTLEDILLQKLGSFYPTVAPKTGIAYYASRGKVVRFIIDGIDVNFFYSAFTGDPREHFRYIQQMLTQFTAEDVKGVEVLWGMGNTGRYNRQFETPMTDPNKYCYLEITTRAGKGPFMRHTPGTYLYRPRPFVQNRSFYTPKYRVKKAADGGLPDIRATIHWEPFVVTDENGEAQISFYTSDAAGNYRVIVEGANMNGDVGAGSAGLQVD
ncbi:MAG: hypothetical protein INR69_06905 [Mucilaginibacter polytrichastri]|nr:hypothetical protein [Mucilaginibacter polytrichastri]